MSTKALIIVDVQNDFCPGGALAVPDGDQVVEPLNRMIEFAQQNGWFVYASQDWHPEETTHFKDFGGLWPVHCVHDTPGADFHPNLKVGLSTIIVHKGTRTGEDAYSAFDGCTNIHRSLYEALRSRYIDKVYIGGLATDYCVKATAVDAAEKGFKTYLLTDACKAVNVKPGDEIRAMSEMANAGVEFTTTDEVIQEAV